MDGDIQWQQTLHTNNAMEFQLLSETNSNASQCVVRVGSASAVCAYIY